MTDLRPHGSHRRAFGIVLRLAGSAAILALLFYFFSPRQVGAVLGRLPAHLWFFLLVGYLACHCGGVLKWSTVVNVAGAGLKPAQATRCYFAGLFGTLFLPSLIGGDIVRAGLALRMGRSKAGVVLGSLLDRILDLTALCGIALAGALALPGTLDPRSGHIFRIVAVAVLVAAGLAVAVLLLLPARRFSYRMRRRLVRLREAGRSTAAQPSRIVFSWMLAVLIQIGFILLTMVIAERCGLFLPVRVWLFAWPLAKISALLPVTQGGLGVREAALVALLAPFGASAVHAVAVGLAWDAIVLGGGIASGLIAFAAGRLRSAHLVPAGSATP